MNGPDANLARLLKDFTVVDSEEPGQTGLSRFPAYVVNEDAMKKALLISGIIGALVTLEAEAQKPKEAIGEKWRCYDSWDFKEEKVLVTLTRFQKDGVDTGYGNISTADGINYRAEFYIAGFERR